MKLKIELDSDSDVEDINIKINYKDKIEDINIPIKKEVKHTLEPPSEYANFKV